jgi:hypothetical protein
MSKVFMILTGILADTAATAVGNTYGVATSANVIAVKGKKSV